MEEVTSNLREAIEGWLTVETPEAQAGRNDRIIELAV